MTLIDNTRSHTPVCLCVCGGVCVLCVCVVWCVCVCCVWCGVCVCVCVSWSDSDNETSLEKTILIVFYLRRGRVLTSLKKCMQTPLGSRYKYSYNYPSCYFSCPIPTLVWTGSLLSCFKMFSKTITKYR